jgi:hypothetical protein
VLFSRQQPRYGPDGRSRGKHVCLLGPSIDHQGCMHPAFSAWNSYTRSAPSVSCADTAPAAQGAQPPTLDPLLDQGDLNDQCTGKRECAPAQCGSFDYDMSTPGSNGLDVRSANVRLKSFKFKWKAVMTHNGPTLCDRWQVLGDHFFFLGPSIDPLGCMHPIFSACNSHTRLSAGVLCMHRTSCSQSTTSHSRPYAGPGRLE